MSCCDNCKKLEKMLWFSNIKNRMYHNIIVNNTNIKLDDLDFKDQLNTNINYESDNNSFFEHVIEPDSDKEYSVIELDYNSENESKKSFLSAHSLETQNQQFNLEQNISEILSETNKLISKKNYNKPLNNIKRDIIKLTNNFPISTQQYTEILIKVVNIAKNIFVKKKFVNKKIDKILYNSFLSNLDGRLISYGDFSNLIIDCDDIDFLTRLIKNNIENDITQCHFNLNYLLDKFNNYILVILPIKEILGMLITNYLMIPNIVYVNFSETNDKYSFYVINSIVDGKREWKFDCYLEDLGNQIIDKFLPTMIIYFRKLYKMIYKDNVYRTDYNKQCELSQCDCEQLLENILVLSKPYNFTIMLQNIIIEKSTYVYTDDDTFNIKKNSVLSKDLFDNTKKINNTTTNISQIFDNITQQQQLELV
jgi:hypothetical protein